VSSALIILFDILLALFRVLVG